MSSIYCVAQVCHFSSHDDFIGIYSTKEEADSVAQQFNKEWLKQVGETSLEPPYYSWEEDVSRFDGYKDTAAGPHLNWLVIYTVPSLGDFIFYPKHCTAVEEYEIK